MGAYYGLRLRGCLRLPKRAFQAPHEKRVEQNASQKAFHKKLSIKSFHTKLANKAFQTKHFIPSTPIQVFYQ